MGGPYWSSAYPSMDHHSRSYLTSAHLKPHTISGSKSPIVLLFGKMTPKSARSLEYKHKRRGSTLAPGDCGRSGSSSAAKTPQPLEARVSAPKPFSPGRGTKTMLKRAFTGWPLPDSVNSDQSIDHYLPEVRGCCARGSQESSPVSREREILSRSI
jgi:hypothetical protein